MNRLEQIGQRFQKARERAGLTKMQASELSGLCPVTIWRMETGRTGLNLLGALDLALVYGASLDDLCTGGTGAVINQTDDASALPDLS